MQSKVQVSLTYYDFAFDDEACIPLGAINWNDAFKILELVNAHTATDGECAYSMHATLKSSACFDRIPKKRNISSDLQISRTCFTGTRTPCMSQNAKIPKTHEGLDKMCAHNFRTGKCCDNFMRENIGAVLFPQFYATKKVKGK